MAVILAMTYQKKLGLPNYSSHSCSVSLTVEIPDASVAAQESAKLYQLLQTAVDNEIQQVGYMPDATTYGMDIHYNLACYECQLGNLDEAKGRLKQAFELEPELKVQALDDEDLHAVWEPSTLGYASSR